MIQTRSYVQELGRLHQRMRDSIRSGQYIRGPVRLGALRCSDGRMRTFNRAIGVKPGQLFDMRAVGAKKSFLSYAFPDRLADWLRRGGEHHVMFLTYHFDCIESKLGCKGHGFDTDAAIIAQIELAQDILDGFDEKIRPLVVGFDTRLEELVLHGHNSSIRTRELGDQTMATRILRELWPNLSVCIINELVPLFLHNSARVGKNVQNGWHERQSDHQEVGMVIGRRIGWIVDEEDALQTVMIEDTTIHPNSEIALGIELLNNNLIEGRIPREKGAFVFVCIPYLEREHRKASSMVTARRWTELTRCLVRKNAPQIEKKLTYITAVICEETRELTILEGSSEDFEAFGTPHPLSLISRM